MALQKNNFAAQEEGAIIVTILIMTIFIFSIITSLLLLSNANLARARARVYSLQSQYAAESGADAAIAILNNTDPSYSGTGSDVTVVTAQQYKATYSVTVTSSGSNKTITATGKLYAPKNATSPTYTRKIEVTAQQNSSNTTSSLLSRNILEIQSGVKNINAKDIYLNGYIHMNKNTTNLIAENITVAGVQTSAGNCSIYGSGNLVKPSSFTTSGQTKTNLILAYNNCISPPGNTSNSNFNVSANQSAVSKIQSTYVPWAQYMDSSYQASPGGCSDWTTGTFPRDIPSTGNTKKTHYPDSGSNISASCGTSGNLNLSTGQYNIKDNVHIRANLCGTSGCTPTFYNPDSTIKFVFVEGTIMFNSLQTAAGSGPIVFVSYGADPSALSGACPLGGSIYMGNSGNSSAPAAYLLASNGLCLDKTKWNATPGLGGLSGKNVYVSTNPGTPADLALDPTFPTSSIPVNLAWRATQYRRL